MTEIEDLREIVRILAGQVERLALCVREQAERIRNLEREPCDECDGLTRVEEDDPEEGYRTGFGADWKEERK